MPSHRKTDDFPHAPGKRPAPTRRIGLITGSGNDVRDHFTQRQLNLVGTLLMQWNETEFMFSHVFVIAMNLRRGMVKKLLKVVDSQGAREAMVRRFIEVSKPPDEYRPSLMNTLTTIADMRQYRNLIAHCRMFNVNHKIAESFNEKGNVQQVLISDEMLLGLFARIKSLQKELVWIGIILSEVQGRIAFPLANVPEAQRRKQAIRRGVEKLQKLQKRRASLPPLPQFPAESLIPQEGEG